MHYIELSKLIKNQADSLIAKKQLHQFFSEFGEVFYTGSYALDLMTWRDIDLQIRLYDNKDIPQTISSIFNHMVHDQDVIHMEYTDSNKTRNPKMPEGYYLQFRIKETDHVWKMDLWILKENDFDKNINFMTKLEEKLNENIQVKDLILKMKFDLMANQERPPKMASYYLYQAVLFENIIDPEKIKNYIKSHDVKL